MAARDDALAQLRARRRALGAIRADIAAGIGLRPAIIAEIERGLASDELINHYAGWLSRMERWTPDVLARQLTAARAGARFSLSAAFVGAKAAED